MLGTWCQSSSQVPVAVERHRTLESPWNGLRRKAYENTRGDFALGPFFYCPALKGQHGIDENA